jgi:penicillin-binding protein 2
VTEFRTRTRLRVLAALVVFMFSALATRLWFLQVLASDQFSALADQNQVRLVPIQPERGLILDRNGVPLVSNRPSTILTVDRLGMGGDAEGVLYRLSTLLGVPVQDLIDRLDSVKYLPYQPVPVAEDVPKEIVFYIKEHPDLFKGVNYELGAVRDYPEGSLAAHILGYVGEISDAQLRETQFRGYRPGDIVGHAGVESTYDVYLHGVDGLRGIQVNAQGLVLDDDFGGKAAQAGDNLVLSIDSKVQALTEAALRQGIALARHTIYRGNTLFKAPAGAAIVMDPNTGQIIAMASYPSYDPSIFLGGLSRRESVSLDYACPNGKDVCQPTHDLPLLNRVTQGQYPAGSTFKPFVAAAALKEGIAKMDGRYACPPGYVVPHDVSGHVFHNWSSANYGNISIPQAFAISCDTVFYQFGYDFFLKWFRSGKTDEVMQRDLEEMGFGRKTGIDIAGEFSGKVPTDASVRAIFQNNPKVFGDYPGWQAGDNVVLSIGQGFLQVTPLQLAVAYSALANGGTLWQPHLGLKVQSPDGQLVRKIQPQAIGHFPLSKRQITFLRNALNGVTVYGTAHSTFEGFPLTTYPVAGKTGTADIVPQQPTSWFAGMAPSNDPKYVVVAMVEQGGHGATTAAPIVRRILEGLFGLPNGGPLRAGDVVD